MKAKATILAICLGLIALGGFPAQGQDTAPIQVKTVNIENQFPTGLLFQVGVETLAPVQVKEIKLEIRVKGSKRGSHYYLELKPASAVVGRYRLKTSGAQRLPPGTLIEYNFTITDSETRTLETPKETYLYMDNRFEWNKVSEGSVEVYYYGSATNAQNILEAAGAVIDNMGALIGVEPSQPIRILTYNSPDDIRMALVYRADIVRNELWYEGEANYDYGVILMLGNDVRARGISSHEMTHILVAEATKDSPAQVPSWLDEGLAEYGNISPDISYDRLLSELSSTSKLLPLRSMQAQPGKLDDVRLFYSQARAIVRYLVDTYGEDKIRQLFAALKKGERIDSALISVYSLDQDGLDNAWRKSLGLPEIEPAPQVTPQPAQSAEPAQLEPGTAVPREMEPVRPVIKVRGFGCSGPVLDK